MTWIIGVNSFFGYSFALSDVKVSWGNNYEKDCLQKFYPITNNIGAGFAGSVRLGFKMLEGLADCIRNEKQDRGFIPDYIAKKWSKKAKRIYSNAPNIDKQLGCHLLMIGTFPKSAITIGNNSVPRSTVIKLCAPDFKPYIAHQHEIISIGSGSNIDDYKEMLKWMDSNFNQVYGFAEIIGLPEAYNILITNFLESNPRYGIGKHMHIITAGHNGIAIQNNDRQNEDGTFSLKMPHVARGYQEFVKMANGYGFKGEAATT
jgi:hypothetical protein